MTDAAKIFADPAEAIPRMVREAAARELKRGDKTYIARVTRTMHDRANNCGCSHNTCGGCRTILQIAAELERV
jgi:hypothetical protein